MDIMTVINSENLRVLFQPILDNKKGVVVGYEALARGPACGPYEYPRRLFRAARRVGRGRELEMACFRIALAEYRSRLFDLGALFFVNFHPVVLSDCLEEILYELDGCGMRTVIEVTEASGFKPGRAVLNRLRGIGVRLALDDVGVGDRSFSSICDVEVDYLKVDKGVVRGIVSGNGNAEKYGLVMSFLVRFGEKTGAKVIAEGVETFEQVSLTERIGVELMQGFYFAKPAPADYWVENRESKTP